MVANLDESGITDQKGSHDHSRLYRERLVNGSSALTYWSTVLQGPTNITLVVGTYIEKALIVSAQHTASKISPGHLKTLLPFSHRHLKGHG